ncbi:MAG: translation initiation factor IF-2 [Holosporales bacterium]
MNDTTDTPGSNQPQGGGRLELKKKIDLSGGKRPGVPSGRTVTVEVKRKRIGAPVPSTSTTGDGRPGGSSLAVGGVDHRLSLLRAQQQAAQAPATTAVSDGLRKITKAPAFVEPVKKPVAPPPAPAPVAPTTSVSKPPIAGAKPLNQLRPVEGLRRSGTGGSGSGAGNRSNASNNQQRQKPVLSTPIRPGMTSLAPARAGARTTTTTTSIGAPVRGDEPLKRVVRRPNESPLVAKPAGARSNARVEASLPVPAATPARGKGGKLKLADTKKTETKKAEATKKTDIRRRSGKVVLTLDLEDADDLRTRSLAAVRRQREKMHRKDDLDDRQKIVRDVVIPEVITVQELANRMAERTADVVKCLMRMGVMAMATQTIDADTAELVTTELGHTPRRVSAADVEIGLGGEEDTDIARLPRAPVVTIMGHVDHGKTSLLDALRSTDVAGGEAGGITQHIGAYKVTLPSGKAITFLDTPGHEAFTEMRARGANVTDIVVLVVAADDGIMPQTIEAISHAKAAKVPLIVAINKVDKPGADVTRVRTDLLSHEVQVEQLGGDVQSIEVSAKKKLGLEKLEEAILLQAEILDLRANPDRGAQGRVIEAKLDIGRGPVATILVQRGTLRVGDMFVSGGEWGKVRALVDEHGKRVKEAGPSTPVEVLGLGGVPDAGDDFVVVENDEKAREVSEFRQGERRQKQNLATARGGMESLFAKIRDSKRKELPVIVKTDVQGSLEAIRSSLQKLRNDELAVQVLHSGVGSITESDISLAKASGAAVIGFNVRANPQARDAAKRDGVEIRYYSIIYDVLDDVKKLLGGMLAPTLREIFLGYAQIRRVFDITKVGKIAGCMVTEGIIKRGCKVRLLRDNIVIHEGSLKTLKRLKDEVREVKSGFECGMAFDNYQDIRENDQIECFELQAQERAFESSTGAPV